MHLPPLGLWLGPLLQPARLALLVCGWLVLLAALHES